METQTPTTETEATRQARLIGLLREQVDLYQNLEGLMDRQHQAVRAEETEPLLRLLADRQRLTDRLVLLSARLAHEHPNWETTREQMSGEPRQAVDALVRESQERLGRILERDEADARMLSARRTRVASAVLEAQAGGRMLSAYGTRHAPRSVHIDRTDEESTAP
jgi:flagellar biosynthesis/type III secretory pathway chaperone